MIKYLLLAILLIIVSKLCAENDHRDSLCSDRLLGDSHKFKATSLILPSALIVTGVIGTQSRWMIKKNEDIRYELTKRNHETAIDDYAQYAPMVAVYAMNAFGLRGKHNFRDRTAILAISYAIQGATVTIIKRTAGVVRPDGSNDKSFPSGHTATAFMAAEYLRQEYQDVSSWIGVGGYAIAVGTGFMRMAQNRHWLNDVIMGAGIGILSTKAAYWIYPPIQRAIWGKRIKAKQQRLANTPYSFSTSSTESRKSSSSFVAMPYYNGETTGLCGSIVF